MTGALTAVLLVGATAPKKSSSFSPIILIYAVIAAAFYFLYYRPRKRKAQEAREVGKAWDVGDEVLTAGGIVGYIIDIDGDRVTLETSVGASFVVLRQYVIRKIEPVVAADDELEDYHEEEPEEDEEPDEDEEPVEQDHDEAESDEDEDEDETEAEADEPGAEADDSETEDDPDAAAGATGGRRAGNRRSRRRGLQGPVDDGEDSGGHDGPSTT